VSNHGGVDSLGFDATGSLLAVGGQDGSVSLWDLATRSIVGPPLASQGEDVAAVRFTADGQSLIAGSTDQSVVSYYIDPLRVARRACEIAARNLTPQEWRQQVGTRAYHRTCSSEPAA
jgi:WD40 repeat protein